MSDRPDIADSLAEVAREINSQLDLSTTLDAIVRAAQRSLPGMDRVGISIVHRDGKIETMAGTDALVWELDALQYELGEGPCFDSIEREAVIVVNELRQEQRWGKARHVEDLNTALQTRKVIGQAIGIVMERYQLGEDRAFQFLVRVSSHSNVKLRDIAQELVDQANFGVTRGRAGTTSSRSGSALGSP